MAQPMRKILRLRITASIQWAGSILKRSLGGDLSHAPFLDIVEAVFRNIFKLQGAASGPKSCLALQHLTAGSTMLVLNERLFFRLIHLCVAGQRTGWNERDRHGFRYRRKNCLGHRSLTGIRESLRARWLMKVAPSCCSQGTQSDSPPLRLN